MSLRDFIATNVTATGALTREALERAFEQIANAPPHPCSLGRHVVSPQALRRGGWTRCANCYGPVFIPTTEGEE